MIKQLTIIPYLDVDSMDLNIKYGINHIYRNTYKYVAIHYYMCGYCYTECFDHKKYLDFPFINKNITILEIFSKPKKSVPLMGSYKIAKMYNNCLNLFCKIFYTCIACGEAGAKYYDTIKFEHLNIYD
jgi:hypothetical protein